MRGGARAVVKRHILLLILIAVLIGIVLTLPPSTFGRIGRSDFNAYWSASYLLAQSQDFTDRDLMLAVEAEQTERSTDYAMMTWNPPWLLALLLPLTIFDFSQAALIWLFVNIGIIFTASILIWRMWPRSDHSGYRVFVAPVVAFAFSSTLVALIAGQVSALVLLGLVLFLYFHHRSSPFLAGAALTLVMVKPHLVYISLAIIFLQALSVRRWRFFAGFCLTILLLTFVVFGLRPTVLSDYLGLLQQETRLLRWNVPTMGGAIQAYTGSNLGKYLALIVLPITVLIWWVRFRDAEMQTVVTTATVLSLITAPFGWSYDLVLLLIPIIQLVAFSLERESNSYETILVLLLLLFMDVITFYLRLHVNSEVFFFWVAPLIGILYLWMLTRGRNLAVPATSKPQIASSSS